MNTRQFYRAWYQSEWRTTRLRSGMVDINGQVRSSGSPFGGFKHSGYGREGGVWGLEEFLEVKAVGGWSDKAAGGTQ